MGGKLRRIVCALLVGLAVALLLVGADCRCGDETKTNRETDTEPAVERVIQWKETESGYEGRTIIRDNGSSRDEP